MVRIGMKIICGNFFAQIRVQKVILLHTTTVRT